MSAGFPLTLSLSPLGRGDERRGSCPSPRGEREGPGAERWEGEGTAAQRGPCIS
jgi:hypothetical protein